MSKFNQNFENWNLIIIDDNSDEKTKDALRILTKDQIDLIKLKMDTGGRR